ncbi:MAG: PQQ-binding-like beta-propeller repeat protein [Planctomycetota bacterium]|jgi:outer membrane protein assembly factor BamB
MSKYLSNSFFLSALAVSLLALATESRAQETAKETAPSFAQQKTSAHTAAAQWGHWRGPSGSGKSDTAKPPQEFGPDKALRWKVPIAGQGSGSPAVWDQKVFLTSAVATQNRNEFEFHVYCLDRQTGKTLWDQKAVTAKPHEGTHETNGYASASPCTDGDMLYAFFGSRGLFAYSLDGKQVWSKDLGDMQIRNGFGEGSSPTIAGDLLIVPWDHEGQSMLYALNKKTGDIVWQTKRDEPTCWATPLIASDPQGNAQIIMNGQTAARGYDLATGKELWQCSGQTQRPCASAVAQDGVAYVASGFRGSYIGAFDLSGRGKLESTKHLLWSQNRDTPDVASPLLTNGRLYYYKEKTGLLTCVEAKTGKTLYSASRVPGVARTYASPVAANGKIYLTDRGGTITVIEDSAELKVLANNNVGEGVDATPALVGSDLLVRGEKHLFCFSDSKD